MATSSSLGPPNPCWTMRAIPGRLGRVAIGGSDTDVRNALFPRRIKRKRHSSNPGLVQPLIALTLRTREHLSRNCYAWDARAPVNAILLR